MKVRWIDGQESWVSLKELKSAYPIETAEYAKIAGLENEPAFA